MYTTKRYKRVHTVHNIKVFNTCLACGMIFENVEFFLRDKKIIPSLKEKLKDRLVFIRTDRFEIIHVRYRVGENLVFLFPKGQYESKYGSKFDSIYFHIYIYIYIYIY